MPPIQNSDAASVYVLAIKDSWTHELEGYFAGFNEAYTPRREPSHPATRYQTGPVILVNKPSEAVQYESETAALMLDYDALKSFLSQKDASPVPLSEAPERFMAMSDSDLVNAAIDASGLSARHFAVAMLARDERTVRRWQAGDAIPTPARDWLTRFLALPARTRVQIVRALE